MSVKFCQSCGAGTPATAKFCSSCGEPLAEVVAAPPQPPPQPPPPVAQTTVACPDCGGRFADRSEYEAHYLATHRAAPVAQSPTRGDPADGSQCRICGVVLANESFRRAHEATHGSPGPRQAPARPAHPAGTGTGFAGLTGIDLRQNVTISGKTMPIEVALVIGALLAAAAFLLWPVATNIGDVIRAVSHSGFERDFGLFLLCLLVFVAGMGVGLVILAWQLLQRDRVGRGVTYVVAGTLIAAVLFAKTRTGWDIGVAIASAAVIFLLGFSDPAREWFTGPESRTHALPVPIVVSATVATVMAAGTILVGLALLALGHLGDSQVQGVLLCVTGLITLAVLKGVRAGNQQARLVLSGLMIAAIVLTLSVGSSNRALGVVFDLGLAGGVLYCLWGPEESRSYFDTGLAPA